MQALTPHADQVRRLLDTGRPPPRLAALLITGRTTLPEMAELRQAFGGGDSTEEVVEISAVLS